MLLTRREAAALSRLNIERIDWLIRHEELPAYRPSGRRILILREDLLRVILANPVWKKGVSRG
jgi:excisionase family DNA binding protein